MISIAQCLDYLPLFTLVDSWAKIAVHHGISGIFTKPIIRIFGQVLIKM